MNDEESTVKLLTLMRVEFFQPRSSEHTSVCFSFGVVWVLDALTLKAVPIRPAGVWSIISLSQDRLMPKKITNVNEMRFF